MGCLVALFAVISPRLAIFFLWLFDDDMKYAFSSWWIGFLGFLLLPWTTLAWTILYAPVRGVTGFGWFLVILAFFADLATHHRASEARRART
jgi:hypothetical protein